MNAGKDSCGKRVCWWVNRIWDGIVFCLFCGLLYASAIGVWEFIGRFL